MSHPNQPTQNSTKRPTRSWSALLWAGLLALGSTPAPQAVHAVESCQSKDLDIERKRAECLRNEDLPGYVNALNERHSRDANPQKCVDAIQNGLWTFAKQEENRTPAIQAHLGSDIAKNLPDSFLLDFGLFWYDDTINCLKEAGLLVNKPVIQSIFNHWMAERFADAYDELIKWHDTQDPKNFQAKSLLFNSFSVRKAEVSMAESLAAKGFDVVKVYYDKVIKNIMYNKFYGEKVSGRAFIVQEFIRTTIRWGRGEEVLQWMENNDFWFHILSDTVEDLLKKGKQRLDLDDCLVHGNMVFIRFDLSRMEDPDTRESIKQLISQHLALIGQTIKDECHLIAKLPDQRLNLRDLVLAQTEITDRDHNVVRHAGQHVNQTTAWVRYSRDISQLNRATSHLVQAQINFGNHLTHATLQVIDSYLRPDTIINEICTLQGPRIKKFVRQQCARVLPGQAVPETFAEQIDVLVREFQRLYPRPQRKDQQPGVQPIEQQVLALASSEHQQEESKDNNPARERQQ